MLLFLKGFFEILPNTPCSFATYTEGRDMQDAAEFSEVRVYINLQSKNVTGRHSMRKMRR